MDKNKSKNSNVVKRPCINEGVYYSLAGDATPKRTSVLNVKPVKIKDVQSRKKGKKSGRKGE